MSFSSPADAEPFDLAAMNRLADAIADPGFGIFTDFLSPVVTRGLVQLIKEKVAADALKRAGVGKGAAMKVLAKVRTDSIFWLKPEDGGRTTLVWLEAMQALCAHFRSALFLPLWSYEGHLARYDTSGFYKPHLDRHERSLARQVSIITYLNDDWDEAAGGQLRLFTGIKEGAAGPFIDVVPRSGTVVIFRSADFWHEVLPSKQSRLSLTGWLRGRADLPA